MSHRGSSSSRGRRSNRRRGYGPTGFEEQGGYMAAKKAKLSDQFQKAAQSGFDEERHGIFRGVAIFVNGYTEPTAEELKRIMIANGGTFHHYYSRSKTTHIIASNLPDSKVKNLRSDRIVSPKWISDSLKAGNLLDYKKYILYTSQSTKQPRLQFEKVPSTDSITYSGNEPSNLPSTDECAGSIESVNRDVEEAKSDECKKGREWVYHSEDEDLFADSLEINREENTIDSNKGKVDDSHRVKNVSLCSVEEEKGNESYSKREEGSLSKTEKDESLFSDSFDDMVKDNELYLDEEEKIKDTPSKKRNESLSETKERLHGPAHHISPSKGHSISTANPKFLSEFYNNSRLHHISTMGAMFKQYVTDMQSKKADFPGRKTFKKWVIGKRAEYTSPIGKSLGNPVAVHATSSSKSKRTIMHIDMDCFFVSVGLRNRPELKGKPVAVTHSKGSGRSQVREGMDRQYELNYYKERAEKRLNDKIKSSSLSKAQNPSSDSPLKGKSSDESKVLHDELSVAPKFSVLPLIDESCSMSEIASCSYEARKAGVRNGMYVGPALKLCPNLKTIPYDFEGYKEVACKLYDIVASFTHDIEAVSCDEMFVDLTELLNECQVDALEFVSYLREEVQGATNCPCSAGIGPNMLIARMATRRAKPNGQYMINTEDLSEYMINEKASDLPGVGWSLGKRLESQNIKTCGDLQVKSLGQLQALFGNKTGQSLYYYCRGVDERPVRSEHVRKSVSAEVNYGIRFTCQDDVTRFIGELAVEVENRLNAVSLKGKCITLKLKIRAKDAPVETAKFMGHGVCDNIAKSTSLGIATSSASAIDREVLTLLRQIKVPPQDFRGVGIQVSRLEGHHSSAASSGNTSIKKFMLTTKEKNENTVSNDLLKKNQGSSSSTNTGLTIADRGLNSKFKLETSPQPSTSMQRISASGSAKASSISTKDHGLANKGTIDLEVLMALPEDMREQVIAEYEQQGYSVPTSCRYVDTVSKPTTYHSSSEDIFEESVESQNQTEIQKIVHKDNAATIQEEKEIPSYTTSEALAESDEEAQITSFSQVDSSFLAALPAEMREELRMEFEHKKRLALGPTSSHQRKQPDNFQNGGNSNSKNQTGANDPRRMVVDNPSNRGSSSQHIMGGKKRGRPPKNASNHKRKSPVKSKMKISTTSKELISSTNRMEDNSSQDSDVLSSIYASSSNHKSQEENVDEKVTPEEVPNLCGAVELNEVKNLIREWVSSCPNPEEEDVDIIASYYSNLVVFRDLEKTDLLIKYLYRQVIRTCNRLWQMAYCNVVNRVQSIMLHHYEVKLKVPSLTADEL